jgi:hypothetical protein
MRTTFISKLFTAAFFLLVFVTIGCQKNSNPPPIIKDSLVIRDSAVYIDSCLACASLKKGLLVYLPFNGSFADSSGNANPTAAVGGAALDYDEHGNANSAFNGTGNGERVLVTNNGSIKFDTALSISFDLMVRDARREGYIEFVDNTNAQGFSFGVGTIQNSPFDIEFAVSTAAAICGTFVDSGNTLFQNSGFVPVKYSWYNIIATFHKDTLRVYINGTLKSTASGSNTSLPACPADKLGIGGWWDGDPASINGKMDEVRIYNRPLAAAEIAQLSSKFR